MNRIRVEACHRGTTKGRWTQSSRCVDVGPAITCETRPYQETNAIACWTRAPIAQWIHGVLVPGECRLPALEKSNRIGNRGEYAQGRTELLEGKGLEKKNQKKIVEQWKPRIRGGEASALGPRGELHNERAITCENASTAHYISCFAFALVVPLSSPCNAFYSFSFSYISYHQS